MNNSFVYTLIAIVLLVAMGLYANEVRKNNFFSDKEFTCIMKSTCEDNFIPSKSFINRLDKEFLCDGLINKYKLDTEDEYLFFIQYLRLAGLVSNDIILVKNKEYYTAKVMLTDKVITEINYNYTKGEFKLIRINNFCNVFEEAECRLNRVPKKNRKQPVDLL